MPAPFIVSVPGIESWSAQPKGVRESGEPKGVRESGECGEFHLGSQAKKTEAEEHRWHPQEISDKYGVSCGIFWTLALEQLPPRHTLHQWHTPGAARPVSCWIFLWFKDTEWSRLQPEIASRIQDIHWPISETHGISCVCHQPALIPTNTPSPESENKTAEECISITQNRCMKVDHGEQYYNSL